MKGLSQELVPVFLVALMTIMKDLDARARTSALLGRTGQKSRSSVAVWSPWVQVCMWEQGHVRS